ncbi:MAG: Flp pilus assembly protein CpaB [Firmicutes bacterium]|nr:Flp pilus assembly protein CpaB [Bacillota bacterium]
MFRHRYIVLAVVFALLGTILTSHYIKKLEQKALGQGPREQVVVTRVAIAEGTELKNNMVERRMWPADLVPKGAAKDMESVLGRLAGVALEPGEVVLASRLLEGDKQGIAWQLAAGERAVTIDVSNVEGMELEFTPGNRVDVLGVLTDYRSGVDHSMLVAENVRILDTSSGANPYGNAVRQTVVLAVSIDQAKKLALFSANGSLQLLLRPAGKTEALLKDDSTLTTREILGQGPYENSLVLSAVSQEPASEPTHLEDGDMEPDEEQPVAPARRVEVIRGTMSFNTDLTNANSQ